MVGGYITASEELNNKVGEAINGALLATSKQNTIEVPNLRDEIVNIVKTGKPVYFRFRTPPIPGSELFVTTVIAQSLIIYNKGLAYEGKVPQYSIRYTDVEQGISVQIVSDGKDLSGIYAKIKQY